MTLNVLAGAADAHARQWLRAITTFLVLRAIPWLWWIIACAGGCVGLMAVMYVAVLRHAVAVSGAGSVELAARLLFGGLAAAAALGAAQQLALRRAVPAAERWVLLTTLGWFAGAVLAVALLFALAPTRLGWPGDRVVEGGVFGLLIGAGMGVGQRRVVEGLAENAGWWVLNALGWGLGWLVGGLHSEIMLGGTDIGPAFHPASVFAGVIVAPALAGALAGLITGPFLVSTLRLAAPVKLRP